MATPFKGEKLEQDLKTKKVYYYHDTEKKTKEISKEEFKNKDVVIHYPRGFEGGAKYKTIRKFTFEGFNNKLPVGVLKSANFGYGFTKTLKSFAYFINDNYDFNEVIITKGGKTEMDISGKKLFLSDKGLEKLQNSLSDVLDKNRKDTSLALSQVMHTLFPKNITKPKTSYTGNTLSTSLATWGNSLAEFSDADKKAIQDLFEKLSATTGFLTKDTLSKTKEIVDNKYIQETLTEFEKLLKLKNDTNTLEKKWQGFLRKNSWIFSSIFAQPVILFQDEAFVGGKGFDNKGGKLNDFLMKNHLTNNASFLEIKTHLSSIVEKKPYRGADVYSMSKELTGCIGQVLTQRDTFQKAFTVLKYESKIDDLESFNSKCVVLIGQTTALDANQKKSFELFRSSCKDVEIITFDELLEKIKSLQSLMNNDSKAKISKKSATRKKAKKSKGASIKKKK
jgi:hypothetical protein